MRHRFAAWADSPEATQSVLTRYLESGKAGDSWCNGKTLENPRLAMVFTGQGSQYAEMGRALYMAHPEFREYLNLSLQAVEKYTQQPLLPILFENGELIHQTQFTQPLIFALQHALHALWTSWGAVPYAVPPLGHSVGEYAAACAAGIFSLEEAAYLITKRGRLIQQLPQEGGMYSVFGDEETVGFYCEKFGGEVSIAAVNGPEHTVISGRRAKEAAALLESKQIPSRQLNVSHAFHSSVMDGMLEEFSKAAREVTYNPPQTIFISNLTGMPAGVDTVGSREYWTRHVRESVRFSSGVAALAETGCSLALELGPSPILRGLGMACFGGERLQWLPTLRRGGEWEQTMESVAKTFVHGIPINLEAFELPWPKKRALLPTYPFERKDYWLLALPHQVSPVISNVELAGGGTKESTSYEIPTVNPLTSPEPEERRVAVLQALQEIIASILGYQEVTSLSTDRLLGNSG